MTTTIASSTLEAVATIEDGATVMVSGFGNAGHPTALLDALIEHGASDLTIVSNNAGNAENALARLISLGRVTRMVCSFPRQHDSWHFDRAYRAGATALELVPQGNLAERIRAAGAGIGAFYTPTGYGTPLAEGKETREFDGVPHVLELPIHADCALVRAHRADTVGNVVYRKTARNFGPIMAAAARHTVVEVASIVEAGELDPEAVVTPGIYVDTLVETPAHAEEVA